MRIIKFSWMLCVAMLGTSVVNAGDYTGSIKQVFAANQKVYILLENGSGSSTCGAGNSFSIDPTTELGKAMISIALTAKTTNNAVWVGGTGTCDGYSPYSGSEIIASINLT